MTLRPAAVANAAAAAGMPWPAWAAASMPCQQRSCHHSISVFGSIYPSLVVTAMFRPTTDGYGHERVAYRIDDRRRDGDRGSDSGGRFLTGEGGFLQEFLYGYSGLRWRGDAMVLAPSLPSQLAGGLDLVGVRWQGRVVDVHVRAGTTQVVLRSGAPMTVISPAGPATLRTGHPLGLATAGPARGGCASSRRRRRSVQPAAAVRERYSIRRLM